MNCPSADKLSQYADQLLQDTEQQVVKKHIASCVHCQKIVELFKGEEQFIKETLQEPNLPADFDEQVLAQLRPYKRKQNYWRKVVAVAAVALLSVGIVSAVNPSFADFVTSIFSTEKVDSGLNEAQKSGFVEQIDLKVTDQNITIHVEEVMVDTTRLAFTYYIINQNGKRLSPNIGAWSEKSKMTFVSKSGEMQEPTDFGSWMYMDDFTGLVELNTSNFQEDLTLQWLTTEIDGKEGNWQVNIPLPIEKALATLTTVDLQQVKYTQSNVKVAFEKVQFTPSTTTVRYTTAYTTPPEETVLSHKNFIPPQVDLAFTIEDEHGQELATNVGYGTYFGERNHLLSAQGSGGNTAFSWEWQELFSPIQAQSPTLVVAGFLKNMTVQQSLDFHPKQLQQTSFSYNEQPVRVTNIEEITNNHWKWQWPFMTKEQYVAITLDYDEEKIKDLFENWVLEDEAGNYYTVYNASSKTLQVYGVEELNQKFTLHLTSVKTFEPVDQPLRIPLYE